MYLLDTTTVSELMRHNEHTWQHLLDKKRNTVFLCEVVAAELLYGLSLLKESKKKNLLNDELTPLLKTIDTLAWDRKTSQEFATIKSKLHHKGNIIADLDLIIAAHAIRYQCILVTDNTSDFQRIENLKIVSWKT